MSFLDSLISDVTGGNDGSTKPPGDSLSTGTGEPNPGTAVDWQSVVDAANAMAEANLARYPEITGASRDATAAYTSAADSYMRRRYYRDLGYVLPSWRSTLIGTQVRNINQVNALSDSLIQGNIPPDLQSQINRDSAALGIENGLYGQAQSYDTARDLGLTSYDLMQTGANMKAGQVTPMVTSLTNTTKALMPPVTDPSTIYMNSVSNLTGVGTVSPTATMQASAQVAGQNANMVWDQQLSEANRQMDLYQTSVNQQIANQAAQYQMYGDVVGATGNVLSSLLSNPFGVFGL